MHKDVMIVDHIESSYTTLDQVDHHQRKIYEGSMNVFNSNRLICVLNFPSLPYVCAHVRPLDITFLFEFDFMTA